MPIYAGGTEIVGAYAGSTPLKAVYAGSTLVWEPGGGGFNPLTQVPAYNAYWADDPNWAKPTDGGTVTSWRDGGGGGVDLTAGGAPTWHASKAGFNGHAAITFDGVDDYLAGDVIDRSQPFKLVVVAKMEFDVPFGNFIGAGNHYTRGLGVTGAGLWFFGMSSGVDLTHGTVDNATHVHRVLLNGENGAYSIDGAAPAVGGSGTDALAALGVGAGLWGTPGTAGRFCNCSVAFVGLYPGNTDDEALDELVADLMDYYGIPQPDPGPAFPTLVDTAIYESDDLSTTHDITLPSGITDGQLLALLIRSREDVALPVTGWETVLGTDAEACVLARAADGSEGSTVTIPFVDDTRCAAISLLIDGWSDIEGVDVAGSDPPNLEPSFGAGDILWIAGMSSRRSDWTSTLPANYTGELVAAIAAPSSATARTRITVGFRELAAASEDPGEFGITGTVNNPFAFTIAIAPASA